MAKDERDIARFNRRMTSLLFTAGYQINGTVPDDHRAFYRFEKNHEGKAVKSSMVKLGMMDRDLYYHILNSAPNPRLAIKELLANFGVDYSAGAVSSYGFQGVELSPAHASDLRDKGVDVERLGSGRGVPMQPMQGVDDYDQTPSTPGVAASIEQRTADVEAAARAGELPTIPPTPPAAEGPQPPEEPPPPTAPVFFEDNKLEGNTGKEIPQGEVKHVGTMSHEQMLKARQPGGPPEADFDINEL